MVEKSTPDYWLIDVQIAKHWKSTPGYERTFEVAKMRADSVHHWLTARVRNAVTGECWSREAGKGWVQGEPVKAAPPPSSPRAPLRRDEHAVAPASPGPDGIPDEQLPYWVR